jgi:penicillin amidase
VVDDYLKNNNNLTFEQLRDLAINIATTSSWEGGGNPWKFVKPYFEPAFSNPTQAQQDALDLLNAWDGHFVAGGSAQWPAGQNRADAWVLMYQWCVEAMRLTFQDELGNLYDGQSRRILFNVFLRGLMGADAGLPLNYNWFLNVLNDQNPSTADEIIRAALDNVLASLGPRPWGENQRGTIPFVHSMLGEVHSIPFSERSTYAHCVEYDTTGPIRIESMFPLGQSGDILSQGGQPVFDKNFFSMTPVYDYFAHRQFPLFD